MLGLVKRTDTICKAKVMLQTGLLLLAYVHYYTDNLLDHIGCGFELLHYFSV